MAQCPKPDDCMERIETVACRPCFERYAGQPDLVRFVEKWRKIIAGASPTAEPWAIQFEEEAAALLDGGK